VSKNSAVTGPTEIDEEFYQNIEIGPVTWTGKLTSFDPRGVIYIDVNNSPGSRLVLYFEDENLLDELRNIRAGANGSIITFEANLTGASVGLVSGDLIRIINTEQS